MAQVRITWAILSLQSSLRLRSATWIEAARLRMCKSFQRVKPLWVEVQQLLSVSAVHTTSAEPIRGVSFTTSLPGVVAPSRMIEHFNRYSFLTILMLRCVQAEATFERKVSDVLKQSYDADGEKGDTACAIAELKQLSDSGHNCATFKDRRRSSTGQIV